MLLDFTVSNYGCFADEALLSFVRPGLKTQTPRAGQSWQDVTYRVAAVYGANASGKSTLLEALTGLCWAVARPGWNLFRPYALKGGSDAGPTLYDVNFTHEGVRYHYEVEAHAWGIGRESLHSYPHGARRHLFTRTQEEGGELSVKTGTGMTGPTAEVRKVTTPRDLFLASAHRYRHKTLAPIARGLRLGSAVRTVNHDEAERMGRIQWMMARMVEDPAHWEAMSNAVARMADLGVKRIEVREREIPPEALDRIRSLVAVLGDEADEEISKEIPKEMLERMRRSLVFVHAGRDGGEYELGLGAQSEGTVTWLASVGPALDALRSGRVLVVDELDASLHPGLAAAMVELFKSGACNTTGAQLLFTTHDTSLLGNSPTCLLDPGEVWFCEKDGEGASELVPLSDYDTRPGNNEQKRYLAGKFGAIPRVDLSRLLECGFSGEAAEVPEAS